MNQKKTSSRKNQIRNGLRADKGATAEADGKTMLQNLLQGTIPNAHIEISQLPRLSGLRLGLINADFPTGPLPAEVMHAVIAQPAYWAFCWGSGLACAEWILANPALLRDKSVVDIGCGSGVVAASVTSTTPPFPFSANLGAGFATISSSSASGLAVVPSA